MESKPPMGVTKKESSHTIEKEPRKTPLTYVEREQKAPPDSLAGKLHLSGAFIPVILATLAAVLVGSFMFLSKGDGETLLDNQKLLDSKITEVSTRLNSVESELNNGALDRVDRVIESLGDYVKKSEISGLVNLAPYALKSELPSTSTFSSKAQVDLLESQVTSLQTTVTTLSSEISALQTMVEDLQDTQQGSSSEGSVDSSLVAVELKQQFQYLSVSDNHSVGVMRVKVVNNTGKDIQDVILGLGINLAYGTSVSTSEVIGGVQGWVKSPYNNLYFTTGGWGYSMKAGDTLSFEVVVKFNNVGTVPYEGELYLDGWSYK